jgi:hypothetical protein
LTFQGLSTPGSLLPHLFQCLSRCSSLCLSRLQLWFQVSEGSLLGEFQVLQGLQAVCGGPQGGLRYGQLLHMIGEVWSKLQMCLVQRDQIVLKVLRATL